MKRHSLCHPTICRAVLHQICSRLHRVARTGLLSNNNADVRKPGERESIPRSCVFLNKVFLSAFLTTIDQHTVNHELVMRVVGLLIAETYMNRDIGGGKNVALFDGESGALTYFMFSHTPDPFDMHQLR